MVWVGRDLKGHLVPIPLPWAGTPSTRPGCSKPHPASPGILPGISRNAKQNVLNGSGNPLMQDTEKVKILCTFFGCVFSEKVCSQVFEDPYTTSRVFGREWDITNRRGRERQGVCSSLDIQKSMRSDGMDPKVLRELANVIARALYHLWEVMVTGEGSRWQQKANIIFMQGKRRIWGTTWWST